jgi:hypothetical protein
MTATTIHITEEQSNWIDAHALNLSKFVRKLLDKEMFDSNIK